MEKVALDALSGHTLADDSKGKVMSRDEEIRRARALEVIIRKLSDMVRGSFAVTIAAGAVARSNEQNKRAIISSLKLHFGISMDGLMGNSVVAKTMELAVRNNVNLITSIKNDFIHEIGDLIRGSIHQGRRHTDMIGMIRDLGDVTESRARLIARDQTAKINSDLTRERHQSLGITLYIWRGADDNRMREAHRLLNRMLCRYDDETVYSDDDGKTWKSRTSLHGFDAKLGEMVHAFIGHPGDDYQCRCVQIPHVVIEGTDSKFMADSGERKRHPAGSPEGGQFASEGGSDGKTSDEEKQKKIDSIRIDPAKEVNELPRLNKEDLETLGVEDKPVTIHKRVLAKHPEVESKDIPVILGTLYKPEDILPAREGRPYFNFIARYGVNRSGLVMLDVQETKTSFEVGSFHWLRDKARDRKERKGREIEKD